MWLNFTFMLNHCSYSAINCAYCYNSFVLKEKIVV